MLNFQKDRNRLFDIRPCDKQQLLNPTFVSLWNFRLLESWNILYKIVDLVWDPFPVGGR